MAIVARLKGSYPVSVVGVSPIHVTRTNGEDRVTLVASEIDPSDITVDPDNIVGISDYGAAFLGGANPRIITSGATVTVAANDTEIQLNKNSVTTINLPAIATREHLEISVIDVGRTAGRYPVTIVPASGEYINGAPSLLLTHDGQKVTLRPSVTTSNWHIEADLTPGGNWTENWIANGDFSAWTNMPGSGSVSSSSGAPYAQGSIPDGWYAGPGEGATNTFSRELFSHTQTTVFGYPRYYLKSVYSVAPTSGEYQYATAVRATYLEQNGADPVERAFSKTVVFSFWGRVSTGTMDFVPIVTLSMGIIGWLAGQTKVAGDYVTSPAAGSLYAYECTVGGTTGATAPTHTTINATASDGGVTWKCLGLAKGRSYDNYESGPNAHLGTVYASTHEGTPHTGAACTLTTSWQYFERVITLPAPGYVNSSDYTGYATDPTRTLLSRSELLQYGGSRPSVQYGLDIIDGVTKLTSGVSWNAALLKVQEGTKATPYNIIPRRITQVLANDFKEQLSSVTGSVTATGLIANTAYGSQAMRTMNSSTSALTWSNATGVSGNPTIALALGSATNATDGTLPAGAGGTGQNAYTAGDLLYASGASALSKLAAGTSSQVLIGGTTPSWGVVPVAAGGTNLGSYTAGDLLYASGTTTLSKLAAGTSSQALIGGTTPSWGTVPVAAGGIGQGAPTTAYTPVMTATSGSITTTTGMTGYYIKLSDKMYFFYAEGVASNIGTASGGLNLTLPFTANSASISIRLFGAEVAVTGNWISGTIGSSSTYITLYYAGNVSIFTSGNGIKPIVSGFYFT